MGMNIKVPQSIYTLAEEFLIPLFTQRYFIS